MAGGNVTHPLPQLRGPTHTHLVVRGTFLDVVEEADASWEVHRSLRRAKTDSALLTPAARNREGRGCDGSAPVPSGCASTPVSTAEAQCEDTGAGHWLRVASSSSSTSHCDGTCAAATASAPAAACSGDNHFAEGAGEDLVGPGRARRSKRTTVMLRNLPNNYSRSELLAMLDREGFAGRYDFVYLPIDFRRRANLGYAFVNLVDATAVPEFWRAFDGYSEWVIPSAKVCSVTWSWPHQGLRAHVDRYRNSAVMHESVPDEFKPVLFLGGVRQPYPPPTRPLQAPQDRK